MTIKEIPFFMTNPEWYIFNEDEWRYELTDQAPPEAVDSYTEFYGELDKQFIDNKEAQ